MALTFLAKRMKLSTIELKATTSKFEDRVSWHNFQEFGFIIWPESRISVSQSVHALLLIPLWMCSDLLFYGGTL